MKKTKYIMAAFSALVLGVFVFKSQALPPPSCAATVWVKDYFPINGVEYPATWVKLYNSSGSFVRNLTSQECADGIVVGYGWKIKVAVGPNWQTAGCGNNYWAVTGMVVITSQGVASHPMAMAYWACGATEMTFTYTWNCDPAHPVGYIGSYTSVPEYQP